jgi:hypothetical protein
MILSFIDIFPNIQVMTTKLMSLYIRSQQGKVCHFKALFYLFFYYKFSLHKKNAVEPNSNLLSANVCRSIRCHYATDQVYCIDPWGRVCEASMRRCEYELFYLRKTIDYVSKVW